MFQLPEAHKQAAFPGFNGTAVGTAAHWILYPSRFSAEMTLTVTSKTLVIFLIALLPFPFLERTQVSPLKRHPFFEDSSSGLLRIEGWRIFPMDILGLTHHSQKATGVST